MAKTQGNVSSGKTTARGGKGKTGLGKVKAHVARSESGGRSGNSPGPRAKGKVKPTAERTKRGPGAVGKKSGQSASGRGKRVGGGPAPKRAK